MGTMRVLWVHAKRGVWMVYNEGCMDGYNEGCVDGYKEGLVGACNEGCMDAYVSANAAASSSHRVDLVEYAGLLLMLHIFARSCYMCQCINLSDMNLREVLVQRHNPLGFNATP